MIDIKKAKQTFENYVKNYNPENPKIMLKINHIKRVANISKDIALKLNLPEEDVKLAELIGLLHDIGRFEQIRIYNTFVDKKSVNHGELGVKILFEDGLIRNFVQDNQYDNIIKIAILNHNKAQIQGGITERELLHAKIIRDSDKTDIFNVLVIEDVEACYETKDMSKEIATPEIYREFMEEHKINYANMKTPADTLISHFAYVFDYNFKYGLDILNQKGYLDKIYNGFTFEDEETSKMITQVYKTAKEFVEKRSVGTRSKLTDG